MKLKTLENGFSMPVLGMGTWGFGGRESHCPENDDEAQIRALRKGIESGINLIDTAEYYAEGYAEILVGKAIRPFPRETLFLTGKVWKTHLAYDEVIRAAENSLRRMNTDYLDLFLYHQVSDTVPLEETLSAMNELIVRGLVRSIGVSNFSTERLAKAMRISAAPIMVNQVQYNLKIREAEPDLLPFCRQHDVMLQAWRPVRGLTPCELTDELCKKYGVSLFQLALAWLIAQKNVTTLTAMKNPDHIPDNLAALDLVLSEEDVERLRRDMPDKQYIGRVPLS